ncbi:MAG: putative DNA-binding domain-containing protein [Deltaproteobacteria bacterium]|nr:putative DNA-binding domain-containing protein [Deltaproteobacteria bacterium]
MLADHAKAIHRVCFGSEPSEVDLELLGSRERWLVYRDLVRNRLNHVIGVALARTKNAIGEEVFQRAVDEWFSTGGPTTRYLRYVPSELAEFAIPIWQRTEAPWVADLAGYEITAWEIRYGPPNPTPSHEFAFDRRPVLATAVKVLRLAYPVHNEPAPGAGYEPDPTILCLYRDKNHKAIPRKLNPLAADLLDAWRAGDQTVAESVQQVAAAHKTQIGPDFIEKLSTLIADFLNRGILLGGQDPPP